MNAKSTIYLLIIWIIFLGCAQNVRHPKQEFERLGSNYSRKDGEIYFRQRNYLGALSSTIYFPEIINVHSRSFKVLGNYFAKDKNNIYYCARIIEEADRKTFEILDLEDPIPYCSKLLPNSNSYYRTNENHLRIKSEFYAKDKNHVYYGDKKIIGAKQGSFILLSLLYSMDDEHVFYHEKKIENADLESFEIIAGNLAADKDHIFFAGKKIAENEDFRLIDEYYFCNKNKVFYCAHLLTDFLSILENLNPSQLEIYNQFYAMDSTCVYYREKIIENTDIGSFRLLSNYHSKDKNSVYYAGHVLEEADAASFQYLQFVYGKDKKNAYYGNFTLPNADVDSFIVLDRSYAKDKEHVFFCNRIINGADAESFFVKKQIGYDKNHKYRGDEIWDN